MRRSPVRPRSRLGDVAAGLAALLSLVVLVGGIPAALYRLGGNPFVGAPRSWHALSDALLKRDVSGTLFMHALVIVGWVAWASFAISVLAEIAARLRGRRTIRLPGLAVPQRWAAGLITAITLAFSSPLAAAAATPAALPAAPAAAVALAGQPHIAVAPNLPVQRGSTHAGPVARAAVQGGTASRGPMASGTASRGPIASGTAPNGTAPNGTAPNGTAPNGTAPNGTAPNGAAPNGTANGSVFGGTVRLGPPAPPAQRRTASLVYEVRRGDYLGAISQRFGGSFEDAKKLAEANHIADPNMIGIGWRIKLPVGAHDLGPRTHATGRVFKSTASTTGSPSTGYGSGGNGSSGKAGTNGKAGTGKAGSDVSDGKAGAAQAAAGTTAARGTTNAGHSPTGTGGSHTPGTGVGNDSGAGPLIVDMLEASGTLAAVVSLALLVIRKREQLQHRLARNVVPAPSGGVPSRLMDATREDDILRLDSALRLLADEVADWPVEDIPQIAGVWLDQGATTLLLADECRAAPAPFIDDDNGWLLPADAPLRAAGKQIAPLPALCTVGGRANQHVLLDLEYLRMLGIGGDRVEALNLLRYVVVELCHNVWSDDVRVTVAGFGAETGELAAVDPIRIRTRATVAGAIDEFGRQLTQAVAALDDIRTPEVLVIANPGVGDQQALAALERKLMASPGVGMSVVVGPTSDGFSPGRYQMYVRGGGDLHIGFLGDAIVPAGALPSSLLHEVVSLLTAARAAGDRSPLDLARVASRAARAADVAARPVRLAGQHRHDGATDRRGLRGELSDLTNARHVRTAGLSWNT